jgi:hypothetical protein
VPWNKELQFDTLFGFFSHFFTVFVKLQSKTAYPATKSRGQIGQK